MAKKEIKPAGIPRAVRTRLALRSTLGYVSGQGPLDFKTGKVVPERLKRRRASRLQHVGEVSQGGRLHI